MNNIIHLTVIIHWVASLLMISLSKSYHLSSISRATYRNARLRLRLQSTLSDANVMYETHKDFLKNVAKVDPPKRLNTLLELLTITGAELVNPRSRAELNPFLIPVSKNSSDNSLLCYIRWPTQKDDMDLQLVTTTECGIILSALNTDHYCHRLAVELDFRGNTKAETALELLNRDGQLYSTGDYFSILKSGKFPASTEDDLRLILDRYLLLKVGSFPDCFERLASNFLKNGNDVSALVTCERAVSLFYSWGHPIHFHTKMLNKLGRDKEAKDSARASMGMPKFTIGSTRSDLEEAIRCAGFTGVEILGDMHAFRATDPREKDVAEGHSPVQITLDQAGHLMDAVTLGSIKGGWQASNRIELAKRYRDGGYPDMASFIETVN